MTDVVLVSMPYAAVERPSIALGLLKASLADTDLETEVVYGTLPFAERIGIALYRAISHSPTDFLLGEWTFSGPLFSDHDFDDDEYLRLTLGRGIAGFTGSPETIQEIFEWVRSVTAGYINELAESIVARRPRVVGCSSMFQQHCASLALLARVRELSPDTVTLLGGANCEGPMGIAAARAFPWVDLVVSGEADDIFGELCRRLVERGREMPAAELPHGVIASVGWSPDATRPEPAAAPRGKARDLDALPTPDYGDYFSALGRSALGVCVRPGLPVESSRGCWWGEKSHCTFCGLNGIGMGYRAKSASRVLAELDELASRYGVRHFEFVDNILDMGHVKTLLPAIAAADRDWSLFYETKANLKREQVSALVAAGARWIQPGVESLHGSVLQLIGKGNSAILNLQLLKWARELGLRLSWNLLFGFPGESEEWYHEMSAWLPAIFHLQPPAAAFRVRYDRFSPYQMRPADYGLSLMPARTYRHVYPLPQEELMDLAYFFEDVSPEEEIHRALPTADGHRRIQGVIEEWNSAWSGAPPLLRVVDEGDRLRVYDTRPSATAARWTVGGLAKTVYELCQSAQTLDAVLRKARAKAPTRASGEAPTKSSIEVERAAVEAAVAELCRHRLMIALEGKLLSLALVCDTPELPAAGDFPGGTVISTGKPEAARSLRKAS